MIANRNQHHSRPEVRQRRVALRKRGKGETRALGGAYQATGGLISMQTDDLHFVELAVRKWTNQ